MIEVAFFALGCVVLVFGAGCLIHAITVLGEAKRAYEAASVARCRARRERLDAQRFLEDARCIAEEMAP